MKKLIDSPTAMILVPEKKPAAATGPCTSRGKKISRNNAQTHGILARAVVLRSAASGETQEEFDQLFASLREDLRPVGRMEEMLVEKIALCYWKQRRVLRAEAGMYDAAVQSLEGMSTQDNEPDDVPMETDARTSAETIEARISWLKDVKVNVEERGYSSAHELLLSISIGPGGLVIDPSYGYITHLNSQIQKLTGPRDDGAHLSEADKNTAAELRIELLAFINGKLAASEEHHENLCRKQRTQLVAKKESSAIPEKEQMDRIIRYQASLERDFYRASQQLERMQRIRKGEFVAPPASITVNKG